MLKNKMLSASAAVAPVFIEDVFSTYLYTGNGSTQTITNGIDLAGEGGLVWIKPRNQTQDHILFDTERGVTKSLTTNNTSAEYTATVGNEGLSSFNSDGFTTKLYQNATGINNSAVNAASWTFRKAKRFFDVVTYTGDGPQLFPGRTINHNLGVVPGCIIIKNISTNANWHVEHRSLTEWIAGTYRHTMSLNTNAASGTTGSGTYSALPIATSTTFNIVGNSASEQLPVNTLGNQYVAYLFAHDPLGPSGDGSDGLIACGSFSRDGAFVRVTVELGWEPQFLLVKTSGSAGSWKIVDSMRGMTESSASTLKLYSNDPTAEQAGGDGMSVQLTSTGFSIADGSTGNHIYIAIRRGPMREPTVGTEVFNLFKTDAGVASSGPAYNFADMLISARRTTTYARRVVDRLRGVPQVGATGNYLDTTSTATEASYTGSISAGSSTENTFASVGNAIYAALGGTGGGVSYAFRRAPGFFDVVAYTGNDVAGRTVPHNLGVAPELMIVKQRNAVRDWVVQTAANSFASAGYLQTNGSFGFSASLYSPTSTTFTASGDTRDNASGGTYIAYLFATLAGVSKVGSYTGNGSSQTINCGFTSGARFVLIKRTDSTGDWYVWDTLRGIVAGNDPYIRLNTTLAEVTTLDVVDPDNSGFIVNQEVNTNLNVLSSTYIYLAIA